MLLEILISIAILLLLIVITGLGWFLLNNQVFYESVQDDINEINADFSRKVDEINLSIRLTTEKVSVDLGELAGKITEDTTFFRSQLEILTKEPEEGEEQEDLGTFVQQSIITAFNEHIFNDENMKNLQTLMSNTIQEALSQNPMTQMMTQGSELTEEQLKNVDQNAGAFVSNLVTSIDPILPELLNRGMGEGWREEAAANPQTFMLLVSKLQSTGVFNWLQSITGSLGLGGTTGTNTPTPKIGRNKSNF